jgi:hypothetical protein
MKRKHIVWALSVALICTLITSGIVYAVSPVQQAKVFAEECFSTGIAEFTLVSSGYISEKEVAGAYLGDPIKNYTIPLDQFDASKSLKENAKEMPFYVLPIFVDGEVVSDFIVSLEKGKWEFVSVGGNMSKLAYEIARENNIDASRVNMLRFGGQSYLFADTNKGDEIACSPYISNAELKMEKQKTYPAQKIKEQLEFRQKYIQEKLRTRSNDLIGGENFGAYGPLDFNQNSSLISRLLGYLNYQYTHLFD